MAVSICSVLIPKSGNSQVSDSRGACTCTNSCRNLVHSFVQKGKNIIANQVRSVGLKHLSTLNVNELLVFCEYSCTVLNENSASSDPPRLWKC